MTPRDRLKGILEGTRATQSQMAAHIGVTSSMVSAWIGGQKSMSVQSAKRVARAYGIRVDWLLFGDGEMCEVDR